MFMSVLHMLSDIQYLCLIYRPLHLSVFNRLYNAVGEYTGCCCGNKALIGGQKIHLRLFGVSKSFMIFLITINPLIEC